VWPETARVLGASRRPVIIPAFRRLSPCRVLTKGGDAEPMQTSRWALVSMAGLAIAALGIGGGCATDSGARSLRVSATRDVVWEATVDVLRSHYPELEADPVARRIESGWVAEPSPLYRHRLEATIAEPKEGESVIQLRVRREKLSPIFGDYGEAFQRDTWVQVDDDDVSEELLLREIRSRLGVK
jgi:hypothetical protein